MSALFQRFKHLLTGFRLRFGDSPSHTQAGVHIDQCGAPELAAFGSLRIPFFTLVAHVCPEAVQLTALDPIPGQQLRFQRCGVLGGISQPGQILCAPSRGSG